MRLPACAAGGELSSRSMRGSAKLPSPRPRIGPRGDRRIEAEAVYVDRKSGEEMEPVTMILPLAGSRVEPVLHSPGGPARLPLQQAAGRAQRERLPVTAGLAGTRCLGG